MPPSKDEIKAREDFSARYAQGPASALDDVERAVIGDVWGANGFTTRDQADDLAEKLALSPGKRLLDVGSGRGWPGLYLAQRTGCEVVLSDLPAEGLKIGLDRAERDRIACLGSVVCSARDLPFRPESFDALVHTDVLC